MSAPIVSFFKAPVSNTTKEKDLTWSELYKHLTGPPIKLKEASTEEKARKGSYYIRGIVDNKRNDKSLKQCNIIILDVDKKFKNKSLPTPKQFHKALSKKNITHCVHSSATEGRCRVILLTKPYKKKDTDILTHAAWKMCNKLGLKFAFAGESKTKSQAWFSPQTSNGNVHQGFGLQKGKLVSDSKLFKADKKLIAANKSIKDSKKKEAKAWGRNSIVSTSKSNSAKEHMDKFLDGLKSGTIHNVAKSFLGFKGRQKVPLKQAFDETDSLINNFYKQVGKEDKRERWYKYEKEKLKDWFKETDFGSQTDVDENFEEVTVKDFIKEFSLKKKDIDMNEGAVLLYKGICIEGQLTVLIAPPNAGKTAILFFKVSAELAKNKTVLYIDVDSAANDRGLMQRFAAENGFKHICPDSKKDTSVIGMMNKLGNLSKSGIDLSGEVFIVDTLKKLNDMMSKSATKDVMKMFKRLTSLGATVIVAAHSNKRTEANGDLIYEGTNDILSEPDALIYLYSDKDAETKDVTTSSYPHKERAEIGRTTFLIKGGARDLSNIDDLVEESNDFVDVKGDIQVYSEGNSKNMSVGKIKDLVKRAFFGSDTWLKKSELENKIGTRVSRRKLVSFIDEYSDGSNKAAILKMKKGKGNAYFYKLK